jgi:predicted nuclease of predicted toxin-antitoxin system
LLVDENFDQRILRGLKLRLPSLDYAGVQDIGLRGADDPVLLEWAANAGRIVLTHDVNTVTKFAIERVRNLQV